LQVLIDHKFFSKGNCLPHFMNRVFTENFIEMNICIKFLAESLVNGFSVLHWSWGFELNLRINRLIQSIPQVRMAVFWIYNNEVRNRGITVIYLSDIIITIYIEHQPFEIEICIWLNVRIGESFIQVSVSILLLTFIKSTANF